MRLTTKGRFAVTAMIDLALRENNGPGRAGGDQRSASRFRCPTWSSCSASCAATSWSRAPAARAAAIRSAARPTEITVADIIVAVDEPIDATGCAGKENCMGDDAGRCMTHDLWASLNAKMIEFLDSVSLKKLVDEQLAKGVSIEEHPVKRAISTQPVVKPIKSHRAELGVRARQPRFSK